MTRDPVRIIFCVLALGWVAACALLGGTVKIPIVEWSGGIVQDWGEHAGDAGDR